MPNSIPAPPGLAPSLFPRKAATPSAAPSTTPTNQQLLGGDPLVAYQFLFEVNGVEIGLFNEVSGLSVSVGVLEVAEGGQNEYTHILPGRMTWSKITMKSGITASDALFQWFRETTGEKYAAGGDQLERPDATIAAVDQQLKRLRSWTLREAMPIEWQGPNFDAKGSDVLTESLVIAHHGFKAETH